MGALTKKFKEGEGGDVRAERFATSLPDDFRKKLDGYFRKSSELIKHFFGTRRLAGEADRGGSGAGAADSAECDKLAKIVQKMEGIYREIEAMRRELPQDESGIKMGRMLLPIMDQLDWVFKIHRDSGRRQGAGGFVVVNLK